MRTKIIYARNNIERTFVHVVLGASGSTILIIFFYTRLWQQKSALQKKGQRVRQRARLYVKLHAKLHVRQRAKLHAKLHARQRARLYVKLRRRQFVVALKSVDKSAQRKNLPFGRFLRYSSTLYECIRPFLLSQPICVIFA